jgi:hypothetical protein
MPPAIPTRVQRALDLAAELQFELSCSPEGGRLLRVSTEVQISARAVPPKGNAVLLIVRADP